MSTHPGTHAGSHAARVGFLIWQEYHEMLQYSYGGGADDDDSYYHEMEETLLNSRTGR